MNIIVFGGSGFLGSHVADVATENGHDVTIFDLKKSKHLKPGQKMIEGDILNREQVQIAMEGQEIIYHFAGLADLDDAASKPLQTVEYNILGTTNVLDEARKFKIKRLIFASTVYVYSDLGGFYRCSKQACELYIEEYQKKYGLEFTILRYGSLYGPRADDTNSIRIFLRDGLVDGKIIYRGTGEETREYVHVKDAAKLSMEILSEKYKNQHVTITGHQPMKVKDMLQMANEILSHKVEIDFKPASNFFHYDTTPYSFTPKVGNKLVSNCYTDMGQGLLECLHEIYEELNQKKID
jgi:UDP-glucose 4-epimerase